MSEEIDCWYFLKENVILTQIYVKIIYK